MEDTALLLRLTCGKKFAGGMDSRERSPAWGIQGKREARSKLSQSHVKGLVPSFNMISRTDARSYHHTYDGPRGLCQLQFQTEEAWFCNGFVSRIVTLDGEFPGHVLKLRWLSTRAIFCAR